MKNNITNLNTGNAYLRQFQIAQLNYAKVTEEERLAKRIRSSKKRSRTDD